MKTETKVALFNICGIVAMILYFVYDDLSWLVWALFMYVSASHNETLMAIQNVTNTKPAGQGSSTEQPEKANS